MNVCSQTHFTAYLAALWRIMTGANPLTNETLPQHDPTTSREPNHLHYESLHQHVHSEESLRRIINQLSRLEGHVRGIKVMVQESRPCPEVLIQLAAVRGAIDRVSRIILDEHLTHCIARAAKDGNIEVEIEQFKAALDRFLPLAKPKKKKTSTQKP